MLCIAEPERSGGPGAAEPSAISHFWRTAGDQSERGQQQTEGKEEGAGLREFAGSLVYSVVVLTSERTPADTGAAGASPM